MGQDLIGNILVGPVVLLPANIEKAKAAYKALRDEATKALRWTFNGFDVDEDRFSPELKTACKNLEDFGDIDCLEDLPQTILKIPENLVDEVVSLWAGGGGRDVMGRPLPELLSPPTEQRGRSSWPR